MCVWCERQLTLCRKFTLPTPLGKIYWDVVWNAFRSSKIRSSILSDNGVLWVSLGPKPGTQGGHPRSGRKPAGNTDEASHWHLLRLRPTAARDKISAAVLTLSSTCVRCCCDVHTSMMLVHSDFFQDSLRSCADAYYVQRFRKGSLVLGAVKIRKLA